MTDTPPTQGLSAADLAALDDLRRKKDWIGDQLGDESLPAHVRGRLLTEFRQYVVAILEIEECHYIAGEADYLLKIRARDMDRH